MYFPAIGFNRHTLIAAGFTLACALSPHALAQDTSGEDSTVIYPASYFTEWAPITAQDMLVRIPGQDSGGGGGFRGPPGGGGPGFGNPTRGGRGLGSGSGGTEIMINGKRTAGKNNSTQGLLGRIPADQVQEIQIIRGTSGELDVRGSTQVINVVLTEELATNNVSWDATATFDQGGEFTPNGTVALSGQRGALDYLLSVRSGPFYQQTRTFERSVLGDYSPNDTITEYRRMWIGNDEVSFNLGYEFSPNSSLRVNGLYGIGDNEGEVDRRTIDRTINPPIPTFEREDNPTEGDNWEFGSDYEYTLGNGDRFKILGIANRADDLRIRQRFEQQPGGEFEKNLFLSVHSITEERIVRSSYTMDVFTNQDIEFGIERAQTILDSELALGLLFGDAAPSDAVGGLIPQVVSNANSKVEEIRYEPFVIHNWVINPQMSLESTLVYETSEISQTGDVVNKRDFDFIKPKLDFRYDVTPTWQLRGTIERIVDQLSFADFVAANDQDDNDRDTLAGNAELRQQTQWRYSFRSEFRLPDDAGVLNAELYYADYQDVIDRIDVSPSPDDLQSANGNIGDGEEWGASLSASIRMNMIGMPNLLVSPTLELQDSEIIDPFLGIKRRFASHYRGMFRLFVRHDIPQWRFNWGFSNFDRIDGGIFRYDLEDIEFDIGDPRYGLFGEYVDTRGLTYRLDIQNASNNVRCRERRRFVGPISDGILEEIEDQCSTTGVEVAFKISGTF